MKYLYRYLKFNESSQSKKISKYFSYSVVLDWYRDNKETIAKTLNCNVADLANEDELMQQSYGLVNYVINTQTGGNEGREDIEIAGFAGFKKMEKNLIHDILHNMYNVKKKEFDKSLSDLEFTESEILEEIECLGIEESFMKYMNITYLKTDFINQNINMLASYLMMTILKNDPLRIKAILDKEVEPYLEVFGKKYPTENTPFESFFNLFKNRSADSSFRINNSSDFKTYMIELINVGEGISNTSGDRGQYPGGDYYGLESWYDMDDSDKEDYIKDNFERKRYGDIEYFLVNEDNNNESDLNFEYTIVEDGDFSDFKNRESLSSIPIPKEFIDDGWVDTDKWFNFLNEFYSKDLIVTYDKKYLGIEFDGDNTYTILSAEEFDDYIREYFNDHADSSVSTDKKFIDFDKYEEFSFEDIVKKLMRDDDALAIMRRNFRVNDVIKNNTKLGNLNRWNDKEIKTRERPEEIKSRPNNDYIDFEGSDFASDKSISKIILTDNGKKLTNLLNNLKGYVIRNIEKIKDNFKKTSQKFKKEEIEQFKKIDMNELLTMLKTLSETNFNEGLKLNFELGYNWRVSRNNLEFLPSNKISSISNFSNIFKNLVNFRSLIKSKRDVDFLKNFVNEKGLLKTSKDLTKFRRLVTKIGVYDEVISKYKYKEIIDKLNNTFGSKNREIAIDEDIIKILKDNLKDHISGNNLFNKDFNIKEFLIKILQNEVPYIKVKNIEIIKIGGLNIDFTVDI